MGKKNACFSEPCVSQLQTAAMTVTESTRRTGIALSAYLCVAAWLMCSGAAVAQSLTGNFPIPNGSALPYGITAGPDGNVWFAESNSNNVGRITPAGAITEFPTLSAGSAPNQIATGSDGNLWATLEVPNAIGRITPAGVVTQFPVITGNSHVNGIAAGPDGNLWFAEENANRIGRITTAGIVTEFPTTTAGSDPINIAAGPDGNLWFTETNVNKIGRITTAGVITEFTSPSGGQPFGITGGPDGNVWYTKNTAVIGRITPAGVITEFPVANPGRGITTGPDGNLWYPTTFATLGRITPSGVATEFPLAAFGGIFIVTGPDGNLWITGNNNNILRFSVTGSGPVSTTTSVVSSVNPSAVGQSVTFTATVAGNSPTGTVQFKDGAGNLGAPVALSGSTASITTSSLTAGTHSITAVYSGDANNLTSTSPALTQTVNAAPPPPPSPGQPIPTLSEWMLLLLAGVVAGFGFARLRSRRSSVR